MTQIDLRDHRRSGSTAIRELFAALLVSTTIATPAAAECTIEEAMHRLEIYDTQVRAEIAGKTSPMLREQEAINERAKKPNLGVDQPLSRQDFSRADQLNAQMMILRSQDLVNSTYLRDARAIVKAANVALQMRQGATISDNHLDAFYQKVAKSALAIDPHSDVTISRDDCSVDAGLFLLERLGMDQVDFQAGSAATDRGIEYVHTVENLRTLNKIAIMQFQANMDDIHQSEERGDLFNRFGKTWDTRVNAGYNKLRAYNQLLTMIDRAIPSDFAIENQRVPDASKRGKHPAAIATKQKETRDEP